MTSPELPLCPRPLRLAMRPLPPAPLGLALGLFARRLSARHPGLLRRLGDYAGRSVLIDPTDLPFVLRLQPDAGPRLTAHRRGHAPPTDARIAGPLSALTGMVHGRYDGDALFFSRDLLIEGDTEAVLALRNALDDAELDLGAELEALAGPLGRPAHLALRLTERATGLSLHRAEAETGGLGP